MYKVLIVEDEKDARDSLIRQIPWAECGYSIVGEAENGVDGLDMFEQTQPDLLITDIRMPYMDGIEMASKAKEHNPNLRIIFVTGYDEFDYAREAVHLGAVDYTIKPVNTKELIQTLLEVKETLDLEIANRQDLERLRSMYEANLPVLRGGLLLALLEGRIDKGHIDESAHVFRMEFGPSPYVIVCVMMEQQRTGEDAELYRMGIAQRIKQQFDGWAGLNTLIFAGRVYVFISLGETHSLDRIVSMMDELCRSSNRMDGVVMTAGVGHVVQELSQLHISRQGAVAALDYRLVIGAGQTLSITDIEPSANNEISFDQQKEDQLISALRAGSSEMINNTVDSILEALHGTSTPYDRYEVYLLEVVTAILRIARSYNIPTEQVFQDHIMPFGRLRAFDTERELREWLIGICMHVSGSMRAERAKASNYIVDAAKSYAQENFRKNDFSVEAMCHSIGISPAYFSTLFKRETKQAFVSYLTDLRMSYARQLLDDTDMKTYLIAEQVGFSDANYFSFVFKKRYGISPTRYRNGDHAIKE